MLRGAALSSSAGGKAVVLSSAPLLQVRSQPNAAYFWKVAGACVPVSPSLR